VNYKEGEAWLRQRMDEACDWPATLRTLSAKGFTIPQIQKMILAVRPRQNWFDMTKKPPPLVRWTWRRKPNVFRFQDDRLQLYTLKDFMSSDECDALVNVVKGHYRESTLTYSSDDSDFRTSSTADLIDEFQGNLAAAVETKICKVMGINESYGEASQVQKYEVGQQFKAHFDAFDGDRIQEFFGARGQRTWTFMVYLNDVEEGGHTHFTEIDCAIKPVKGSAVFWNNLNADGTINQFTKHAGLPVIKGQKTIITKWFRAMGRGHPYK
jgi:prolyl 4-hydroxylase